MSDITLDRRSFLRSAVAAAAVGTASGTLLNLSATMASANPGVGNNRGRKSPDNGGYGPLVPDTRTDNPWGAPLLSLPAGFTYTAFGLTGEVMSDGNPTPGNHDGMAAFPVAGDPDRVRLVRNHELSPNASPDTRADGVPLYDEGSSGGTTNLLYDLRANVLEEAFITLGGTTRNCAGGPTPWGSWLSCEEDYGTGFPTIDHGYVFEVPADATGPVDPVPLRDMGRFVHEAVAVDPATGYVYETEDRGTSGFYRFVPTTPGVLADGGTLQMLAIEDQPNYDTRGGQRVGKPLPVRWVDIDDPDPSGNDALGVYRQGIAGGAATFDRLEGAWYGDGAIYFVSTSGGDAGVGQVWEYRPRGNSGGQLVLVFESPDSDLLEAPDNVCVSPGGALVLCEDGSGPDFLRGIDQKGRIFDFGRNDLNGSEWCGSCFSPDGSTMFVNMQSPGITFAIQGPWDHGVL